ncbi:hypothetical protein QYF61_019468 [Mycteria americana]|uniref:Reverse transcriptase domain-containing protein n=1 Tax=Mycteria americana TaxID=33587 RepID=A0AAN7P0S1_MYCAM|nr:hypothetical protein QYF61_019468 [Mycteria americana]
MGPHGMYPLVLRELAGVIARLLSIIFDRSQQLGEVPKDWRKIKVTPIFKKGKKEHPGKYRLVSLPSIPGKEIEQLILETISRYIKDKKFIRSSQHGFTKGHDGAECTLSKFVDDTKLGGVADFITDLLGCSSVHFIYLKIKNLD